MKQVPKAKPSVPFPKKMLDERPDAERRHPDDRKLLEQLQANGAKPPGETADILNKTDDFRLASNGDIRRIAISDIDARTMRVVSRQVVKPHEAPSGATYRVQQGDIITAIPGASEERLLREDVAFHRRKHDWSNRLIAGDSPPVMNSLLKSVSVRLRSGDA